MKIMTILGTRPEIIRLSRIIPLLDKYSAKHILAHTGQNFDRRLSDIFFEQLNVRQPDIYLGVRGSTFSEQIAQILTESERLFIEHRPDRLLILGDTNSGLCSIVARRLGIPVYHMEAGNRCFDDRVPEEVNRRIIDHSSTVLMPYTNRSKENLLREGFHLNRIFVIGNPIKEVIDFYESQISSSKILELLGIERKKYFLLTMHRAENVDWETRLRNLIEALCKIWQKFGFPIICSLHPRTREKIERFKINIEQKGLIFQEPFGFFDFVHLEKNALCVLTDSGTVQEECCIFKVPNVTIRDVTERPETVDCGSNILAGEDPEQIVNCTEIAISKSTDWNPPFEYLAQNVALTTAKIVLGYRWPDFAEQLWLESKSISRKHLTREK